MKKNQDQERIQKARYGAPDGPRQRKENYDGSTPLEYPGHEAVAEFLAFPKSQREFETITALAEHFGIARETTYRLRKDRDVLERAEWLSRSNAIIGRLAARRSLEKIVDKAVEQAENGDVQSMKCVWVVASSAERQPVVAGVNTSPTFEDAVASTRDHLRPPDWVRRQQEQRQMEEDAAAKKGDPLPEHKDLPE